MKESRRHQIILSQVEVMADTEAKVVMAGLSWVAKVVMEQTEVTAVTEAIAEAETMVVMVVMVVMVETVGTAEMADAQGVVKEEMAEKGEMPMGDLQPRL